MSLPNKTAVLAKRANDISAFKALISTKVEPTEAQLEALDTISDLRSRKRPVPDDVVAIAASYDPAANSNFENTLGLVFGMVLELADQVQALQSAASGTPVAATPAPVAATPAAVTPTPAAATPAAVTPTPAAAAAPLPPILQ